MGASEMASGRKPSMDRISARRARGAGVGVMVSVGVNVNVGVTVDVEVTVIVAVDEGVNVADNGARLLGIWQAKRSRKARVVRRRVRVFIRLSYNKQSIPHDK